MNSVVTQRKYGDEDVTWKNHSGVKRETEKAKLFKLGAAEVWVPKSVIVDEGDEQVGIKKWWADDHDIEGDW